MPSWIQVVGIALLAAAVGCSRESPAGVDGGLCLSNDLCYANLVCVSNVCIPAVDAAVDAGDAAPDADDGSAEP